MHDGNIGKGSSFNEAVALKSLKDLEGDIQFDATDKTTQKGDIMVEKEGSETQLGL